MVSVSLVRIISGSLSEPVGPFADYSPAIDILDTGHDAPAELLLGCT
jgi:hypothetical protein